MGVKIKDKGGTKFKKCRPLFFFFSMILLFISKVEARGDQEEKCSFQAESQTLKCSVSYMDGSLAAKKSEAGNEATDTSILLSADRAEALDIFCDLASPKESILRSNHFGRLPQLTSLNIRNCNIRQIPGLAFSGLGGLTSLTLRRGLINDSADMEFGVSEAENPVSNNWDMTLEKDALVGLNGLRRLDVSGNNIFSLPKSSKLCSLTTLTFLNASSNHLQDAGELGFSSDSFDACSLPLRDLDLSRNGLSRLASKAFGQLNKLERLDLSSNNLAVLADDAFSGLGSLVKLDLSDNELVALPASLFIEDEEENNRALPSSSSRGRCCSMLQELHLQENSLSGVPSGLFRDLQHLLVLNLSSNDLSNEWLSVEAFSSLMRLVSLDLSHNRLSYIKADFFVGLTSLQLLDLTGNDLDVVPASVFAPLHNLHILRLSENKIDRLRDDSFDGLAMLSELNLSGNLLSSITADTLRNCSGLIDLSLSNNRFETFPAELLTTSLRLKSLDMSDNMIENLGNRSFLAAPGTTVLSSTLEALSLEGNRIESLEEAQTFAPLPRLRAMNLARNSIKVLGQSVFNGLDNLRALRLDDNQIEEINGVVAGQTELRWLNVSFNRLLWFDYAFFPKNLEWLDVRSNYIEELGNYYKLDSGFRLSTLKAGSNRIKRIGAKSFISSLRDVNLRDNRIQRMAPSTLLGLPELRSIDLSGNLITRLQLPSLLIDFYAVKRGSRYGSDSSNTANANNDQKSATEDSLRSFKSEEGGDQGIYGGGHHNERRLKDDISDTPRIYLRDNPLICDCDMEWVLRINTNLAAQPQTSALLSTSRDNEETSREETQVQSYPFLADLQDLECEVPSDQHNSHFYRSSASLQPKRKIHRVTNLNSDEFVCPYEAHCFALCMCCDFVACDCRMQCPQGCACFHDSTWSSNVIKCSQREHTDIPPLIPMDATKVYLDGNNFTGTLESQAFIGRKRVQTLYLNSSQIEAVNNQTFNGLTELRELHLEHNQLQRLEGYEFTNLTSLKKLYLNYNRISFIHPDTLSALVSLRELDLRGNRLGVTYPYWDLPNIVPSLKTLSLGENRLSCQCEFVEKFYRFIATSIFSEGNLENVGVDDDDLGAVGIRDRRIVYSTTFISSSPSTFRLKVKDLQQLKCWNSELKTLVKMVELSTVQDYYKNNFTGTNLNCVDSNSVTYMSEEGDEEGNTGLYIDPEILIPAVIVALASCLIVICLIILVFVFRTPLRVWLHAKYGIRFFGGPAGKSDKLYDAFLSYCVKDEDFVHRVILAELEQKEGYKLCLQHRDLPANASIADTFASVSQLCAKQIILVSRSYLDTEWTRLKYALFRSEDYAAPPKYEPVIVLLEDLTTLELASTPEFNVLLNSNSSFLLSRKSPLNSPSKKSTMWNKKKNFENTVVLRWNDQGFWNKLKFYLPDVTRTALRRRQLGGQTNENGFPHLATADFDGYVSTGANALKFDTLAMASQEDKNVGRQSNNEERRYQFGGKFQTLNGGQVSSESSGAGGGLNSHSSNEWSFETSGRPAGTGVGNDNNVNAGTLAGLGSSGSPSSNSPRTLSSTDSRSSSSANTNQVVHHQAGGSVIANPLHQSPVHQPVSPIYEGRENLYQAVFNAGPPPQSSLASAVSSSQSPVRLQQQHYDPHQQHQRDPASQEHIYHTLEPDQPSSEGLYDTLGKLDVMLPNGQFVPATLVRNKANGALMPLVDVDDAASASLSPQTPRTANRNNLKKSATPQLGGRNRTSAFTAVQQRQNNLTTGRGSGGSNGAGGTFSPPENKRYFV